MATASFPTLQVFVGFSAASAQSYLFFDDTVLGLFDTGTFAGGVVYTNIATDVREISVTRGRQRQIEAFAAGTCSVVLDNNSGDYDPDNSASPYWVAGATTLLPMRQINIRAVWGDVTYNLFSGFVDRIEPDYAPGSNSDGWCTITATDGMKVLQNIKLNNVVAPAERANLRINRILNAANWPGYLRFLDTSEFVMQAATLSGSAAQEIQNVVDSEYGRWYIDPAGRVRFENRVSRNKVQTSAITWADTGTSGRIYSAMTAALDDELVRNQVTVQNVGGTAQTVSDATSITNYQSRTFSLTNALLKTDLDAYELAHLLVYQFKDLQGCRFERVMFQPATDPTTLWPEVLARKISDRVNVTRTPPGVGALTVGGYVEGMSHHITTSPQSWETTYHASRKQPTTFLQFDDATYGVLESTSNTFGF